MLHIQQTSSLKMLLQGGFVEEYSSTIYDISCRLEFPVCVCVCVLSATLNCSNYSQRVYFGISTPLHWGEGPFSAVADVLMCLLWVDVLALFSLCASQYGCFSHSYACFLVISCRLGANFCGCHAVVSALNQCDVVVQLIFPLVVVWIVWVVAGLCDAFMVLVFVAVKYEYSCLSVNICLVVVVVVFCSCYGFSYWPWVESHIVYWLQGCKHCNLASSQFT